MSYSVTIFEFLSGLLLSLAYQALITAAQDIPGVISDSGSRIMKEDAVLHATVLPEKAIDRGQYFYGAKRPPRAILSLLPYSPSG